MVSEIKVVPVLEVSVVEVSVIVDSVSITSAQTSKKIKRGVTDVSSV
ncbi:hypothetical protein ES703_77908 [subsurface metagenome]